MKRVYDMCTGQPVETSRPEPDPGLMAAADAHSPALKLQEITREALQAPRFPHELAYTNLTLFLKRMG